MNAELVDKKQDFRKNITTLERIINNSPDSLGEDPFPLKHSFGDGIYVREITAPANHLIITKIFKQNHATFLLSGECSVVTEDGLRRIKAPFSMITKSGTKRVIYTHTDVIWTTVHANPNDDTDIDKIEKIVIADNFGELEFNNNEMKIIEMAGEK